MLPASILSATALFIRSAYGNGTPYVVPGSVPGTGAFPSSCHHPENWSIDNGFVFHAGCNNANHVEQQTSIPLQNCLTLVGNSATSAGQIVSIRSQEASADGATNGKSDLQASFSKCELDPKQPSMKCTLKTPVAGTTEVSAKLDYDAQNIWIIGNQNGNLNCANAVPVVAAVAPTASPQPQPAPAPNRRAGDPTAFFTTTTTARRI